MEDLTFKTEHKKKSFQYLLFLPKHLRPYALISIVCNFFSLLISAIFYPSLQAVIPLYFSRPSDQQLVAKEGIFILPIFATLINLIHLIIIRLAREEHQTILKIFVFVTLGLEGLILSILIRTISIVH